MIDWTLPCETTETPPRPVRVLATDACGEWPVVGMIDGLVHRFTADGSPSSYSFTLRNVAPPKPCPTCTNKPCVNDGRFSESACFGFKPPKPEPVLNERWVNLHRDFVGYTWSSRELADRHAGDRVECRRIAWMSDGSPVPVEENPVSPSPLTDLYNALTVEFDAVKAERDSLKAEIARMNTAISDRTKLLDEAEDEIARMRPVVDAAVAWKQKEGRVFPYMTSSKANAALWEAVRAYQSTPKKTAAEAVANVAKMMGPVKTCNNCKHLPPLPGRTPCKYCHNSDKWEKSHD